jgi:hypothetical protein
VQEAPESQTFPAPLLGCIFLSSPYRGYATKHPSRTPGYYPSALRAGESKTPKTIDLFNANREHRVVGEWSFMENLIKY